MPHYVILANKEILNQRNEIRLQDLTIRLLSLPWYVIPLFWHDTSPRLSILVTQWYIQL